MDDKIRSNRAAQREIYGEPLGDVLGRCREVLGLNQTRLAAALGISAPMLSQVMTGHRIKIGNPAAVRRLQVMVDLLDDVAAGRLAPAAALTRIDEAGVSGDGLTGTTRRPSERESAAAVQGLFRGVASATDFLAAAGQLESDHPAIAELLRVQGAGSLDEAVSHVKRVTR